MTFMNLTDDVNCPVSEKCHPNQMEIWKLTKQSNNFAFVAFPKYILMYIQGFLTNNAATKIRQGRAQHSLKWMQNKKKQCAPGLRLLRSIETTFSWSFSMEVRWRSKLSWSQAWLQSHCLWVTADEDNFTTGLLTRELGKHHYLQWLSCHPPWKWAASVYVSPSKSQYALGSVESH